MTDTPLEVMKRCTIDGMYTQIILQITIAKSERMFLSATELDWVLRNKHTHAHSSDNVLDYSNFKDSPVFLQSMK